MTTDPDPEFRPADWTAADEAAWKAQGWTQATWEAAAVDHAQAACEAMYGTPAEQAAEAAVDEAEAALEQAWSGYLTDTFIIPGLHEPPEPEADL